MSTNRSNGNGRQRLENAVKKLVKATHTEPTHIQKTSHFELEVLNQLRTIENSITRLQTTILRLRLTLLIRLTLFLPWMW